MISLWCNKLELNMCKTKEICIDFRTSGQFDGPLCIGGEAVEVTDTFKFLGITFNNKMTFGPHVQGVYKKVPAKTVPLRYVRSCHVDPKLLLFLYRSIIDSVLTYCNIFFFLLCLSHTKICFSVSAKLLPRS